MGKIANKGTRQQLHRCIVVLIPPVPNNSTMHLIGVGHGNASPVGKLPPLNKHLTYGGREVDEEGCEYDIAFTLAHVGLKAGWVGVETRRKGESRQRGLLHTKFSVVSP